LRIINRYLIKEVVYTLLAVTPILLFIFLSSRFVQYLADAASGKFPADIIFVLLGLKSITVFPLVLPLVFFLSIVLALGRLYVDSEMTSLAACGIGTPQVLRIMTPLILSVAVAAAFLSLLLSPWAVSQSNEIKDRSQQGLELSTIVAGRFKESKRGEDILYAEKLSADARLMDNVFIQSRRSDKVNVLSSANASKYYDKKTGDQFLLLKNGSRYELSPNHTDFRITQYEKYFVRFQQADLPVGDRLEEKPTLVLLESTGIRDIAELQWRISMPVSVITLGLIGVLLARTTPRQGRYAKLFIAILIYIIYINMMGVARAWVSHGIVTPLFGMWWVHAVMLAALFVLFSRDLNISWLRFKPRRANGQALT